MRQFKNSKDKDFLEALSLYSKYVHPDIKTNTNEIVYWINNYNKKYKDKFYVLGFYADEKLVGYSEFVHIIEENLVIFDYLVIDPLYRKNNVFFEFIEHLKIFIDQEKLHFNYLTAEIGYLSKEKSPAESSQLLVKLFKFVGGKVVKAPYYQPKLGLYNYDSEMQAVLMLFSYNEIDQISRETYLSIVKSIYYKYYLRWYSMHEESKEEYKKEIGQLYENICVETSKMKNVKLNGHKFILDETPVPDTITERKLFRFVVPSLLFVILAAFLMLKLQEEFHLSLLTLITVYLFSLISYFAVLALFSPSAMTIFTKLLTFIKPFSRKLK